MSKVVLVGIARMGSSRLPGKVMMDLGGKPVLAWVIAAAEAARYVDDYIIATTTDPRDDVIFEWCNKHLVACYRGSEDDVLERFTEAAAYIGADIAVRVTCDCPFLDPSVIDQVIALRQATGADYCSNIDPPTWPDGLDCEAMTMATLHKANEEATSKIDRECVTTWIQRNRYRFSAETLMCPLPNMHKERWVLDTHKDYELCQAIAMLCFRYDWLSIYQFLEKHPLARELNAHHPRNERFYAALATEPLPPRNYAASKALLERAEKSIPLGAQTFSKSKIQYPAESPLFLTHADGGYCFDVDGSRYVDLVGGLLPVILGHRDPDVDSAVRRQINRGVCFSLATQLETELAETLCRLIPCAEMVRFGKNGTDVTSAAIRLARAHTGRDYVISSGYHGWADWAVANDPVRNLGVPFQDVVNIVHGDVEYLREPLGEVAAVIVEPETDPKFLQACRQFCDESGALLIFDEIITGFRFGLGGAQELYGITPDLACFGKSMGNGYPISALVGRRDIMKTMEKTSYSGTFFGDAVGLAAAIATIKKLEQEKVLEKLYDAQCHLCGDLMGMMGGEYENEFVSIESNPRLRRLKFADNNIKTLFIQEMAQQGVLVIASNNLSYAHGPNEIKRVLTAYGNTFDALADAIKTGTVQERIKGRAIPASANVRAVS